MKFDQLITQLQELDGTLKRHVTQTANVSLTLRNWLVGAYIVEFEQNGKDRANYGEKLISEVASNLKISGLPPTTLRLCRSLYLEYPEIRQTLSVESQVPQILKTLSVEFLPELKQIPQVSAELPQLRKGQTTSDESSRPDFAAPVEQLLVKLSFSHFVELLRIGARDYFIDLVFYHRKLHCHVLIDLKVEPFTHGNAGQLNTYLNYYRKHEMAEGDNPPVGLLLCTDKDHALVEYAVGGMDENLFVSSYKVALPNREELEAFLRQQIDSSMT